MQTAVAEVLPSRSATSCATYVERTFNDRTTGKYSKITNVEVMKGHIRIFMKFKT